MPLPKLLTFDVFGTIVDWRRGLAEAVRSHGYRFDESDFDEIVDAQGADEAAGYKNYRKVTSKSLEDVLGLSEADADAIGAEVGRWPAFADSAAALKKLMARAPCVAMTNSDKAHGEQAQEGLGLRLSNWFCAEETRVYKPSPEFWKTVGEKLGEAFGKDWWHVSAYADYDLETAGRLGLTTVLVQRPHFRPGPSDITVEDLAGLACLVG